MSHCSRWESQYLSYMEGSLDKKRLSDMRRHVEGCGHCRDMLERLGGLLNATAELGSVELKRSLEERILARVAEARATAQPSWAWRLYEVAILRPLHSEVTVLVAACVSVLTMLGMFVYTLVTQPELAPRASELLFEAASRVGGWHVMAAIVAGAALLVLDFMGLAAAPLLLKCVNPHKGVHGC